MSMTLQYSIIYYKICQLGLFLQQKWHFMQWQNISMMPRQASLILNTGKDIIYHQLDYNFLRCMFRILHHSIIYYQIGQSGQFLQQKCHFMPWTNNSIMPPQRSLFLSNGIDVNYYQCGLYLS